MFKLSMRNADAILTTNVQYRVTGLYHDSGWASPGPHNLSGFLSVEALAHPVRYCTLILSAAHSRLKICKPLRPVTPQPSLHSVSMAHQLSMIFRGLPDTTVQIHLVIPLFLVLYLSVRSLEQHIRRPQSTALTTSTATVNTVQIPPQPRKWSITLIMSTSSNPLAKMVPSKVPLRSLTWTNGRVLALYLIGNYQKEHLWIQSHNHMADFRMCQWPHKHGPL
jgi:hypothetical protein